MSKYPPIYSRQGRPGAVHINTETRSVVYAGGLSVLGTEVCKSAVSAFTPGPDHGSGRADVSFQVESGV